MIEFGIVGYLNIYGKIKIINNFFYKKNVLYIYI